MKNVVQDLTSAGIDWQREKWQSGLGSKFIHQGEKNAAKFGFDNEKKIVHGLVEANIDIVECGFLMNTVEYDRDVTKFTSLDGAIDALRFKGCFRNWNKGLSTAFL